MKNRVLIFFILALALTCFLLVSASEARQVVASNNGPQHTSSSSGTNGQKVFVPAQGDFRKVSLLTWKGLPRLGLPAVSCEELEKNIKNNKSLAEQQYRAVEHHNYSFNLLNMLDNMRVHADCYSNLTSYGAKIKQCAGTVIQHSAQASAWMDKLRVLACALTPDAYEGSYRIGKTLFPAAFQKVIVTSDGNIGHNLNEFDLRDWHAKLMARYDRAFENVWRSSHMPEEAWHVFWVSFGDYDFEKKQYTFFLYPGSDPLKS